MNRRRLTLACVALLLTAACGGTKRPPAVTGPGATSRPARPPAYAARTTPVEPVDQGPELLPSMEGAGLRGTDLDFAGSLEGGPLADIRFDYDRATLSDEGRATLERHAAWLQSHRETRAAVEGHCDERGTVEYNLALGEQRARAARDYLVQLGVAGDRLRTVSYGKERPLDPGRGEEAWARNRRAHFAVTQ